MHEMMEAEGFEALCPGGEKVDVKDITHLTIRVRSFAGRCSSGFTPVPLTFHLVIQLALAVLGEL